LGSGKRFHGLPAALLGAALLGALSTGGDVIWDTWIRSHRLLFGLIHGVVICLAMGLAIGLAADRPGAVKRGVMIAPLIGLIAAGSFYGFYPFMGYLPAMVASWVLLWLLCAWLHQRLQAEHASRTRFLIRGLVAALLSGMAFFAISDIWTDPPTNPNYGLYFLYWAFAFFPGFLALFFERNR